MRSVMSQMMKRFNYTGRESSREELEMTKRDQSQKSIFKDKRFYLKENYIDCLSCPKEIHCSHYRGEWLLSNANYSLAYSG